MKNLRILSTAALLLTGAVAWANSTPDTSTSVLRGSVSVAQANGELKSTSVPVSGEWMRADKPNTAVEVPGALIRFSPGSEVRFNTNKDGGLNLSARGGKVYVALQDKTKCKLSMGVETVTASQGEFAVDASYDKLYVVSGDAQKVSGPQDFSVLGNWDNESLLLLDTPDAQKKLRLPKSPNESQTSRRPQLGEDNAPSLGFPTPAISPSLALSPNPETPSSSPSPTPPQPSVTESDRFPWEVVGVLGGLGIGVGLLAGGNPPSSDVVTPISP